MKKILLFKLILIKRKHDKFVFRLERALGDGSFHAMHVYQKNKLLQRVEKVKLQLSRLESVLKYGSLAAVAAVSLNVSDAEAQMTAQGTEFRVNTYTTGNQSPLDLNASVEDVENEVNKVSAMDANGNFVITWQSLNQAGASSGYDIYAQRYDAAGVAQGSEFLVNTFTTGKQYFPAVEMDASGDFVIAWQSLNQTTNSAYDIYAQRYNASGIAQDNEFLVNTNTAGSQVSPVVAMDDLGNFIVGWSSPNDVYFKRYNSAGVSQGAETLVNNYTTGSQQLTSAAMDATGDFVVVWQSYGQNGSFSNFDIYAKRYNSSGVAQGTSFLVNTGRTYNTQSYASVDMDANGDFVIAWQSMNQLDYDGHYNLFAKKYDNAGTSLTTNEFLVNGFTNKKSVNTSVAMQDNGNFIISWVAVNVAATNSLNDVYVQRFNASTAKLGTQFLVNTYTASNQSVPCSAMNGLGNVVVTWASNAQDGSGFGMYAQRYFIGTPTTGILNSTNNAGNAFNCYPNPTKGILNISMLNDLGETNILISNSTGTIVFEDKQILTKDVSNLIDLSAFPAGIYIVQLISENCIESKKIVIQ